MGASNKPKRVAQVTSNAGRIVRTPKTPTTKVNSPERAAEVEEFKAARPGKIGNGGISRGSMIAWAATNPNLKSNAARNLAKNRKPKPPKTPKA